MSDYQTKPGNGAIFKNDKKEKETHPDYRGNFKGLDGKDYDISLWLKEAKSGKKYFSVSVQEPYQKLEETKPSNPLLDDDDLGLPF